MVDKKRGIRLRLYTIVRGRASKRSKTKLVQDKSIQHPPHPLLHLPQRKADSYSVPPFTGTRSTPPLLLHIDTRSFALNVPFGMTWVV